MSEELKPGDEYADWKAPEDKLPGGPLQGKPVRGKDGNWYNQFGEEIDEVIHDHSEESAGKVKAEHLIDKDEEYANRFWERKKGVKEDLKLTMIEVIKQAADSDHPFIGSYVNPKGITEEDKEKLSAYRKLAQELGYEVGQYKFHRGSDLADAEIHKPNQ